MVARPSLFMAAAGVGVESEGVKFTAAEARRGGEVSISEFEGDEGEDEVLARLSSESSIELELERARFTVDVVAVAVDVDAIFLSGSRVALSIRVRRHCQNFVDSVIGNPVLLKRLRTSCS